MTVFNAASETTSLVAGTINRAKSRLKIQYHQQSTKPDKLADHHSQFHNLGVAELMMKLLKKSIIHVVMIQGHAVSIFQRQFFSFRKVIAFFIQLRDLLFC